MDSALPDDVIGQLRSQTMLIHSNVSDASSDRDEYDVSIEDMLDDEKATRRKHSTHSRSHNMSADEDTVSALHNLRVPMVPKQASERKFSKSYSINLQEYGKGAHGRHMQSVTEHEPTAAMHYEREVSRSSHQAMHNASDAAKARGFSEQETNGLLTPVTDDDDDDEDSDADDSVSDLSQDNNNGTFVFHAVHLRRQTRQATRPRRRHTIAVTQPMARPRRRHPTL